MTKRLFPVEEPGEDGWSEWVHPLPGYRFACCDCSLVHDLELMEDPGEPGRFLLRMRRNNRSTGQLRRHAGIKLTYRDE